MPITRHAPLQAPPASRAPRAPAVQRGADPLRDPLVDPLRRQASPLVQRGLDQDLKDAEDALKAESVASVRAYSKGWKKKSHTTKILVLGRVLDAEPSWYDIRDHVMEGEAGPKGYHSKRLGGDSVCSSIGDSNPAGAGHVYKQYVRVRGTENPRKISTFFPDSWTEAKIRAAVLLRNAGAGHDVESTFDVTVNDGTAYPTSALENP